MDQPPPPRPSFWRFSLRELLLLMLAIAAFLGWGQAIYQRYKPFVPTPFVGKLDVDGDIMLIRQQLGEPPASWGSASTRGGSGPRGVEREYRRSFPLHADNAKAFVAMLQKRFSDQLDVCGCTVHGSGRGSSGGMEEFRFRYVGTLLKAPSAPF